MPVKNLVHKHLRFMDASPTVQDTSNTMVGTQSSGKLVTDSSQKITGSGFKRMHPTMNGVNSRNKETLNNMSKLVKTVF